MSTTLWRNLDTESTRNCRACGMYRLALYHARPIASSSCARPRVERRQNAVKRLHTRVKTSSRRVALRAVPADVARALEDAEWRRGLEPAVNTPWTDATVVSGRVPAELTGTLYRAGPGRIRLGAYKYEHWFDGDGYLTAIELDGKTNAVKCCGRYVETARWKAQRASDGGDGENDETVGASGVAVRGAWTQASAGLANLGQFPTNPANTSVIVHAGKLLACCEGGPPVEMDPATLATKGEVEFGSRLPMGFSAHSKQDARDGTIYTWGLNKPPAIGLSVAKIDKNGKVLNVTGLPGSQPFPEFSLVHDCAMSENYLTFFVCPWILPPGNALRAISGLRSFGHSFEWSKDRETWMVVMRKSDLSVVHAKSIPSFSSYHTCDSYEENGNLKVLYCRLRGDRTDLERMFGDMYKAKWSSKHYNDLHEMTVDITTGEVRDELALPTNADGERDFEKMIGMEFPVVSPEVSSKRKPKYVYTLANSCGEHGYFDAIQKLNLETKTAETRLSTKGHFPHECHFVPKRGATSEDAGYLIHVEYDATRNAANVVVIDAEHIEDDPVAVIALPMHVPYTFHGEFVPSSR